MKESRVAVVGAGPGGLASAALLAAQGNRVEVFEALDRVGGRNSAIVKDGFTFDLGPTFFLMPEVLAEVFSACGRSLEDYLTLERLDPLYELSFADGSSFCPRASASATAEEIAKLNPYDAVSFRDYRLHQIRKFNALFPSLKKPFPGLLSLVNRDSLKALPFLDLRSVYDELQDYFSDERVRLAFTFQAKYLGMSPFKCPSLFTILSHIEHELGVWHPRGGVHRVSEALAQLAQDLGVKIHLSAPVKEAKVARRRIESLNVRGEWREDFDTYFMNADFAYGMSSLFSEVDRKKYTNQKLESYKYSCSTFMIYAGIEGKLDWPHHRIFFPQNYRRNVEELAENARLSDEPAFYVHNPSLRDDSLAPKGKSSLYILVPVPNLEAGLDWESLRDPFKSRVYSLIAKRTGVDLRDRLVTETVITPKDWQSKYRVYKGATFNLAHSLDQMMHLRPQNRSEEFKNLYLVGGGTHPGSGLPTILQSAFISTELHQEDVKTEGKGVSGNALLQRPLHLLTQWQDLRP